MHKMTLRLQKSGLTNVPIWARLERLGLRYDVSYFCRGTSIEAKKDPQTHHCVVDVYGCCLAKAYSNASNS